METLIYSLAKKRQGLFVCIAVLLMATNSYSQASTCTSINANACTGGNISENFNSNNGHFTSSSQVFFYYSSSNGWWQLANVLRGLTYTITSPIYQLNGNVATIGFTIDKKGGGSCNVGGTANISVADAATGTVLAQCDATIVSGQVCTNISDADLTPGVRVKFTITFTTAGTCGLGSRFAFDDFSVGASAILVPIPVKLTSFSASRKNSTVNLKWQTASEFNNKGFEIQRKLWADEAFETVGFVNAQTADGNSSDPLSYSFNDLNITDQSSQYQLKQVDFDGKYEFSHVVTVSGNRSGDRVLVYPNPSSEGHVNITFNSASQKNIQLTDISGRTQQVWNKYASAQLQLKQLKSGVYLLRITDAATNERWVKKIVVL